MPSGIYKRTQEHNKKISIALTGVTFTEERKKALKGWKHSKEAKIKISIAKTGKTGYWKDKKHWSNNNPAPMKGRHHTKETIALYSLQRKGKKKSEEHKNKIRLDWKNNKDKRIKAILKAVCAGPNKFEIRALAHLNLIYNNKFKYTGDGSFIVNHRSADAYSEELNTIALFNGIYWHLKKYGFKNTEKAKGAIELIESIPFLEAGYKVIFIWEDEL